MKRRILFLLAATVLLPLAVSAQKAPASIKVISYNIRNSNADDGSNSWIFRYPASAMMIDDQQPDVFGLQEAREDQMAYMKEYCEGYKAVGVGREDGRREGECMAIFYKTKNIALLKWGTFWLSETPDEVSKGWDAACKRTATWAFLKDKRSGRRFMMVNTHIDHRGKLAQQNGVALVMEKIKELNKDGLPVVVTGDFNMEPDNPSLLQMEADFLNTRKIAAQTDDLGTFHDWGKVKTPERIDYIWISGFSSCSEYKTVTKPYQNRTFVSDHYPIYAEIFF